MIKADIYDLFDLCNSFGISLLIRNNIKENNPWRASDKKYFIHVYKDIDLINREEIYKYYTDYLDEDEINKIYKAVVEHWNN